MAITLSYIIIELILTCSRLLADEGGDEGCDVRRAELEGCVSLSVLYINVCPLLHQEAGNGGTGVGGVVLRDAQVLSDLYIQIYLHIISRLHITKLKTMEHLKQTPERTLHTN